MGGSGPPIRAREANRRRNSGSLDEGVLLSRVLPKLGHAGHRHGGASLGHATRRRHSRGSGR